MRVFRFIAGRSIGLLFVLFGVTVVTFTLSNIAPGDPAQMLVGPRATPEQLADMREKLGLDLPLPLQYFAYIKSVIQGNFGSSYMTGRSAIDEVLRFVPATLELMTFSLVLSVFLGITFGTISATFVNRWPDHVIRAGSITGISMPVFWTGLILIIIFYGQLGVLPASGRINLLLETPPLVTGFYTIDSLLHGDIDAFFSAIKHLMLPAATLTIVSSGAFVRLVRASMLEVMKEDYIRTAVTNALPSHRVIFRHALRNALIPLVTIVGAEFAHLLFGSVVVESIFAWPGLGSFMLEAILTLDFPVIMSFTVITAVAYVVVNFVVDLIYMGLDPRIRLVS